MRRRHFQMREFPSGNGEATGSSQQMSQAQKSGFEQQQLYAHLCMCWPCHARLPGVGLLLYKASDNNLYVAEVQDSGQNPPQPPPPAPPSRTRH